MVLPDVPIQQGVLSPARCVPAGVLRFRRSPRRLRSLAASDGAFVERGNDLLFEPAPLPTQDEVFEVLSRAAERVAEYLIREGTIDADGLTQDNGLARLGEPWPKSGWLLADGEVVEPGPRVGSVSTSAAEY